MADTNDPLNTARTYDGGNGGADGPGLPVGTQLGHYRIMRLLGRGGMGEVYEVEHDVLRRRFALKLLPSEFASRPDALTRFEREAQVMANLEHPNLIRVDDFGETDARYWLRMELATGVEREGEHLVSLADYARVKGGRIDQALLAGMMRHVLNGLRYAHEHGAIHRDMKPGNVLFVTDEGGETLVKVADFGLVKLVGEKWVHEQTRHSLSIGEEATASPEPAGSSPSSPVGTFEYMSPEQKRGEEADARSDVYAVGLMTYRLLTGHTTLGMELPSEIDSRLVGAWDGLVRVALREAPEERFQSVADLLAELDRVDAAIAARSVREDGPGPGSAAGGAPGQSRSESKKATSAELRDASAAAQRKLAQSRKPASKSRSGVLWISLLVLGLLGAGLFLVRSRRPVPPPPAVPQVRDRETGVTPAVKPSTSVEYRYRGLFPVALHTTVFGPPGDRQSDAQIAAWRSRFLATVSNLGFNTVAGKLPDEMIEMAERSELHVIIQGELAKEMDSPGLDTSSAHAALADYHALCRRHSNIIGAFLHTDPVKHTWLSNWRVLGSVWNELHPDIPLLAVYEDADEWKRFHEAAPVPAANAWSYVFWDRTRGSPGAELHYPVCFSGGEGAPTGKEACKDARREMPGLPVWTWMPGNFWEGGLREPSSAERSGLFYSTLAEGVRGCILWKFGHPCRFRTTKAMMFPMGDSNHEPTPALLAMKPSLHRFKKMGTVLLDYEIDDNLPVHVDGRGFASVYADSQGKPSYLMVASQNVVASQQLGIRFRPGRLPVNQLRDALDGATVSVSAKGEWVTCRVDLAPGEGRLLAFASVQEGAAGRSAGGGASPAQSTPPWTTAAQDWSTAPVELLPLVRSPKAAVKGTWMMDKSGVLHVLPDGSDMRTFHLPVRPEGDYEFEATVVRGPKSLSAVLGVYIDGTYNAHIELADRAIGIEWIDGHDKRNNGTMRELQTPITAGKSVRLLVRVEYLGPDVSISAAVNGQHIVSWRGRKDRLWSHETADRLWLGSYQSAFRYLGARLQMLCGTATVLETDAGHVSNPRKQPQ
ncbi:MAG: serine/threonine protein kinase [Lentisphaerae bacterium]|jgi:serine/threonine protein kinase|nr:serine/threonine protein kinase [Lentisphaerota bacterium]MBT5604955.1 serine/threonine protein kinase [Lentisphaerota bacterium]MBT7056451.1 serine/threonine protein kinase [Lentisphaerota bacterium]MBT7844300.1 serine/threonine protein kinase [Lentisphaerota bacterium]